MTSAAMASATLRRFHDDHRHHRAARRVVDLVARVLDHGPGGDALELHLAGTAGGPWFELPAAQRRALRAAFPAVRAECRASLERDGGWRPYLEPQDGVASLVAGWRSLPLCRDGRWCGPVGFRHPATVRTVDALPWFPGDIMISVLAPGVELPAHRGLDDLHATVHLPLIVPPGCGVEVAGRDRPAVAGRPFCFDDSRVHRAWNHGTGPRVHLVVDVWHPTLGRDEIAALRTLLHPLRTLVRSYRDRVPSIPRNRSTRGQAHGRE